MQRHAEGDPLAKLLVSLDQSGHYLRAISQPLAAAQRRYSELWTAISRNIEEALATAMEEARVIAMEEEEALQIPELEAREREYGKLWD